MAKAHILFKSSTPVVRSRKV